MAMGHAFPLRGGYRLNDITSGVKSGVSAFLPIGIWTIPEISMVGQNEQQLTDERIPYEVGIARFSEIARGQIAGDHSGMVKLLFHRGQGMLLISILLAEFAHLAAAGDGGFQLLIPLVQRGHRAAARNGFPPHAAAEIVDLPREHGFPARLLSPGRYGTKNVKWLVGLDLLDGTNVDRVLDICRPLASLKADLGEEAFDLVLCCHVL